MDNPQVMLETSKGSLIIELYPEHAPLTVKNFLELVEIGFYDGLIFHRAIPNYLIQTGCPKGDGSGDPGYTIPCECVGQKLSHSQPGIVAMAHFGRDTGGSQFYITVSPQPHLDNEFTIFGRVIEGLEVVSQIGVGDTVIRAVMLTPELLEIPEIKDIPSEEIEAEEYVERKIAIGFLPAFAISILVTVGIILTLYLTKLSEDPLVQQLELLLLLFTISLTGILTRSKFKGLANIVVAFVVWMLTFIDNKMPWALGKGLGELGKDCIKVMERLDNLSDFGISQEDIDTIKPFLDYGMVFDLIFLLIMTLFFGFFFSVIATGFFNREGDLARITIISKPLAMIFLLLLLPLPIAYHGVMKVGESTLAFGAGAGLMAEQSDELQEVGEASIDKIEELTKAFEEAQDFFDIARKAFDDAQANFLYSLILHMIGDQKIEGEYTVNDLDDIAGPLFNALYYLTGAGPNLYAGIAYLMEGLNGTFEGMGMENGLEPPIMRSQSTHSTDRMQDIELDIDLFSAGVANLTTAVNYFDAATNDVSKAYNHAKSIFETRAYEKLIEEADEDICDALDTLQRIENLVPLASSMGTGMIFFVKATFSILLAIQDLEENDFDAATYHLTWATDNHTQTGSTVDDALAILDPNYKDSDLTNPIWGGLRALSNMTTLISYFIGAAANGTDSLIAVNETIYKIAEINLNVSVVDPSVQQKWQDSGTFINWASVNISASADCVGAASGLASDMLFADYGNLNDSMRDLAEELLDHVGEDDTDGFWGNVTDFARVISAGNFTHLGFWSFANGFAEYTAACLMTPWTDEYNATMSNASFWFGISHANASAGEDIFTTDLNIDPTTKQTLEGTLHTLSQESLICQGLTEAASNGSATPLTIMANMTASFQAVEAAQANLTNAFAPNSSASSFNAMLNSQLHFGIDPAFSSPIRDNGLQTVNTARWYCPFLFAVGLIAVLWERKRSRNG